MNRFDEEKALKTAVIVFAVRICCFILGLSGFYLVIKDCLRKDYDYESEQGETQRVLGFYDLPKDCLDYLVLGSSHAIYSVNAMEIYALSGYKGFVLGGPQQSTQVSYYWLEEAFKTQSPKVVLYDVSQVIDYTMSEGYKILELQEMRLSLNKVKAAFDVTEQSISRKSILFPFHMYHSNWKSIPQRKNNPLFMMGSVIRFASLDSNPGGTVNTKETYVIEQNGEEYVKSGFTEGALDYLEKMNMLCCQNGAKLCLVKFPTKNWNSALSEKVREKVKSIGKTVFDINQELIDQLDWSKDTFDSGYHTNYWGGIKTGYALVDYLSSEGLINTNAGVEYWNRYFDEYQAYEYGKLKYKYGGVVEQLKMILDNNDDCLMVLIIKNDGAVTDSEWVTSFFKQVGFISYPMAEKYLSFIGVVDEGKVVIEKWAPMKLAYSGVANDSIGCQHEIQARSGGHYYGNDAFFSVDQVEYPCSDGLNIIVIDKQDFSLRNWIVINDSVSELNFPIQEYRIIKTEKCILQDKNKKPLYLNDIGELVVGDEEHNSIFKFEFQEDNCYMIRDVATGQYLSVYHVNNSDKAGICLEDYTGLSTQKWTVVSNFDGSLDIISVYSNLRWCVCDEAGDKVLLESDQGDASNEFICISQ